MEVCTVCPEEVTEKRGSPGPVLDEEFVVLCIFAVGDTYQAMLSPGKRMNDKLKKGGRGGLSVARVMPNAFSEVQENLISIRKVKGNNFRKAYVAKVKDLRKILENGTSIRMLCVLDQPQDRFASHASIEYSLRTRAKNYWANNQNERIAVQENIRECFFKHGPQYVLRLVFLGRFVPASFRFLPQRFFSLIGNRVSVA